MVQLIKALSAWGRPDFETILKQEIAQLGVGQLPLQQGMSAGNYVPAQAITATILNVAEQESVIRVKAGIFFSSVIAGCSCADDPTPRRQDFRVLPSAAGYRQGNRSHHDHACG